MKLRADFWYVYHSLLIYITWLVVESNLLQVIYKVYIDIIGRLINDIFDFDSSTVLIVN